MSSGIRRFLFSASLLAPLLFSAPVFAASGLVASVDGVPVTEHELRREMEKIVPLRSSFHSGLSREKVEEVREEAIGRLVERGYKVRYALAESISVDSAVLEERLARAKKKFVSADDFREALGGEGLGGYRAALYRELLSAEAEKRAVEDLVSVGEDRVLAYYRENEGSYLRPKRFKASHIFVKADPSASAEEKAALKKRAEELSERARSGEDFHNLAYYNSDDRSRYVGGDLGYFHQGQTVGEFEEAILQMEAGGISGPVRTLYGYHIIRLDEVEDARQLAFEEVREKVGRSLEERQRASIYDKWMEELKGRYAVERFDR